MSTEILHTGADEVRVHRDLGEVRISWRQAPVQWAKVFGLGTLTVAATFAAVGAVPVASLLDAGPAAFLGYSALLMAGSVVVGAAGAAPLFVRRTRTLTITAAGTSIDGRRVELTAPGSSLVFRMGDAFVARAALEREASLAQQPVPAQPRNPIPGVPMGGGHSTRRPALPANYELVLVTEAGAEPVAARLTASQALVLFDTVSAEIAAVCPPEHADEHELAQVDRLRLAARGAAS